MILTERVKCPIGTAEGRLVVYFTPVGSGAADMSSSEDCLRSVRSSGRRRIPSHIVDVPRPSSLGRDRSRSASTHRDQVDQVNMVDHSSEHGCLARSTPPNAST